ncbi:hypothetical protein AVEN_34910-1 [Araneus ventricosus]|uniref:Uncharacterized protein n=1 Tax=Araneus ventricosus TaxID=182803 RepID=A0A4Y2UYD1_ARAVE|nr:hypothetical protein AVEN_34910-1 [Araneus ventricosus]
MQSINPVSTSSHSIKPICIHPSLQTCSHVFLRVHSAKPPLSPPYTGPHPVISRKGKTFVLKINNKNITVSIHRIKPAYVLSESSASLLSTPTSPHPPEDAPSPLHAPENESAIVKPITTRSGRHVHFPKRHYCHCDDILLRKSASHKIVIGVLKIDCVCNKASDYQVLAQMNISLQILGKPAIFPLPPSE